MKTKKTLGLVAIIIVAVAAVILNQGLFKQSVFSVSTVNIDPQGYQDPVSNEWKGSFWSVVMSTDFDDEIAAFIVDNDNGQPGETYAQTGNYAGISDKTYAGSDSVSGNVLIPTSEIMVHIAPQEPYYEKPLEIQQGRYVSEAWSRTGSDYGGWSGKQTPKADELTFEHYSFADVGGGNWVLHTPFIVSVYKNGALIATEEIDTVGGAQNYILPENHQDDEYVILSNLGKLDTSRYGEPNWDDVLYFNENAIFVRSPTADNLLAYDSGEQPTSYVGSAIGGVSADCFSTYWYGSARWLDDFTPTVISLSGLSPGWNVEGNKATPIRPSMQNVISYLDSKNIQRINMPTGFARLEKVIEGNANYLRVYFDYGTKSSLLSVKISTEFADTIVWRPQVANFKITNFPNFGDVANTKEVTLTVACVEGSGSGAITFTKSPSDAAFSITPQLTTPAMSAGDSWIVDVPIQNLGTATSKDFSVTATIRNVLGSVTDTAVSYGTLLPKTGVATIVQVITEHKGEPINNLPVTIYYADSSQTSTTGLGGAGTATFSLGVSTDISVTASFAGNGYYQPVSNSTIAYAGEETPLVLSLATEPEVPGDGGLDLNMIILAGAIVFLAVAVVFGSRSKGKRKGKRKN